MAFQYNHYYEIYNGGKYVNLNGDHENNVVNNGEKVTMYARTNNPDQRWALERYGSDNQVRIVLQRGGGWYALNYNTENTNCIVWHLNSAADKDTVITLEPAVSFGGVYRLKLAQRNLYLTVVGSSLKWMAFTNNNDQIFSFVEPGANPGSATGNGLSLRCPVSYSGISTKFVDGGHRGVDYIASKGTPVYAATSGRVIRVYSWQGSTNEAAVDSIGNAVFLEHFDSKGNTCGMTCYYHLREAPTSLISLNVFNHETNVDLNRRLVCLDLKKLGAGLRTIAMLIMQDLVNSQVSMNFLRGIATWCYFDEFHVLLRDRLTASYCVAIWKMLRKKGCVPSALTQNVKDFLASPEIENIFENSDFLVLLSQAQGDRQILAKQLGISPHQLSYVTHTNSGEGLLFFGNTTIPFVDRFPQNTELYAIMTTRPEDKKQEMNRA